MPWIISNSRMRWRVTVPVGRLDLHRSTYHYRPEKGMMHPWRPRDGPRSPNGDAGDTGVCCCCFDAKAGWGQPQAHLPDQRPAATTGPLPSPPSISYVPWTAAHAGCGFQPTVVDGFCVRSVGRWSSHSGAQRTGRFSAAAAWPPRSTLPCQVCGSVVSSTGSSGTMASPKPSSWTTDPNSPAKPWTSGHTSTLSASISSLVENPQKPYVESFNGKLRDECLNEHWFTSLADARRKLAKDQSRVVCSGHINFRA